MILTGNEIERETKNRNIILVPFQKDQLNPNSYNYRIDNTIRRYNYSSNTFIDEIIPETGLLLLPKQLYLANTYEIIGSEKYVTSLIGKSSMGRLGVFLQISADLGNLGSAHKWTLEITCVQPFIIYPYMVIGQVSFWKPKGRIDLYRGDYNKYNCPKENMIRGVAY